MIRKTSHAGSFYPRFKEQIIAMITQWIAGETVAPASEEALALLVPHAGYIYSGACAAKGFHYISQQNFDSFIILHPSHQGIHFDYSVSPFEQYETPLGMLNLDIELYELLTHDNPDISNQIRYHEIEHSMEVQLPFIKYFFPNAQICSIMIGKPYPQVAIELAQILKIAINGTEKRVGIIVSSDLSHYYPATRAEKLDSIFAEQFLTLDPEKLWHSIVSESCEACGIGGILTLLYYVKDIPNVKAKIIQYTHSGKVTGDNTQVVGYLSALVYR
ncbi:MAG: AmmeMemoRadiSam system protein B [Candidatus Cloacimonadaceae bacterium]|jgi:AmmeMemoRadiSam system protein B|nr:AmmeMemoRadiSam system protein B [Candidatus Cloacimonadota bacterium]MDY0112300.1 AmmeMemoRadiSam system protein B [Candidatus Syntrophosphaera sp.]